MADGLGGVEDDDAAGFANFGNESAEVFKPEAAIEITGDIDDNKGFTVIFFERDGTILGTSEDFAFNLMKLTIGYSGKKGGVVFDVGSVNATNETGVDLVDDEVETVSGVEGERDEIIFFV